MFKPTPALAAELDRVLDALPLEVGPSLRSQWEVATRARRPDVTGVLLRAARAAIAAEVALPRTVVAAVCRAGCADLGERHGGSSIEVRVPPFAAVQLGFGVGPRHTRGTPPNVVEMTPDTFMRLATGLQAWDEATMSVSGSHAAEARQAFPLV